MFENVGGKIKTFAKVLCWIEILACIVIGIILCYYGSDRSGGDLMVALGVVLMILGPLLAWVGSLFLYGYGDLILDVSAIRQGTPDVKGSSGAAPVGKTDKRIAALQKLRSQNLISEEEYNNAVRNNQ